MARIRTISVLLFLCSASLMLSASAVFGQSEQPAASERVQPEPMVEDQRFSIELKDVPVQEAIAAVFQHERGVPYVIEPNVGGRVTINLKDVTFDSALRTLLNVAGLSAREEAGTLILGADPQRLVTNTTQFVLPHPPPTPPSPPAQQLAAMNAPGVVNIRPWDRGPAKVFDVTLEGANLFEAIKQILELDGKDYVLDLGLASQMPLGSGPRVTARMRQVSLDDVLTILSRTAGLEFEKRANTYIVRYKGVDPGRTGKPGALMQSYPQPPLPVKGAPQILCPNCGFGLLGEWRFCPNCGNPAGEPPTGLKP